MHSLLRNTSKSWKYLQPFMKCNQNRTLLLMKRKISNGVSYDPKFVRNCAIIAHVDHGKTTLMDKLLDACGSAGGEERAMDSNDQEKERGITITSKYTRLHYKDHMLHLVDTPGHADFSGEVERILSMVEGVILLCDATEGPMAQTKFVLSKALESGKKAIVVLNKIDRDGHRAEEVENEIFDLFCSLTEDETQLDYPLLYASSRQGWVSESINERKDVYPLLNKILETFPPPVDKKILEEPFALSVNTLSSDLFLGRIVTGKVEAGKVAIGDPIHVLSREGEKLFSESKVTKLFYLKGMERIEVDEAFAGQIVSLTGCEAGVADTVCNPDVLIPIHTPPISPPVIAMTFGPNTSPLAGIDGTKVTSNLIKDRLKKEIENNVTLSLRPASDIDSIDVLGRGELQIGILVETMRREGFELTVSPPRVLSIQEDGLTKEPFEEIVIDIDPDLQGLVIESMSSRGGAMIEFKDIGNKARMIYQAPSRGLLGFRHEIVNATRGNVTINSIFSHYDEVPKLDMYGLMKSKIVSANSGKTTAYALNMTEERGQLFVGPGEQVYEGMVLGEASKQGEIEANTTKTKKLTNVRASGADEGIRLTPAKKMTVEEIIAYMDEDEVIEVTPLNVRLRKRILNGGERARFLKSIKQKSKEMKK